MIRTGLVFLKSIVIARGLGVEFYGIYALIVAFVVSIQDFFNLNIGNAFIKFAAEYKTNERTDKVVALIKVCLLATAATALLSIIMIAVLLNVSYDLFVNKPGLEWYIFFYAVADVASFFDPMGRSILRLYYKFKINSIIQTITAFIEFIIVTTVVLMNPADLRSFFIAVVVSKIINTIINNGAGLWELRHEFLPHAKAGIGIVKDQLREIGGYIVGNSLSKTLLTLMNQGDVLILGAAMGPKPVAYYAVAKRMANMLGVITDPFTTSVFPQFSILLAENRHKEIKTMLIKITRTAILPSLLVIVLGYFLGELVITTAYGPAYSPASEPFTICLIGSVLTSLFFWNQSLMQSMGLIAFRFKVYLFAIALGGLLSYFYLVPNQGSVGMAIGVVLTKVIIITIFTTTAFIKLKSPDIESGTAP